jgi:hypothetical protein
MADKTEVVVFSHGFEDHTSQNVARQLQTLSNPELGGARYNASMNRDDLRQRLSSGTEELWWRYRFLQDVTSSPAAPSEDVDLALECFARLAMADQDWARNSLDDRGPAGHQLGRLLNREHVHRTMGQIRLKSNREDALLRARMLIASVRWSARRGESQHEETWKEAWQELMRVADEERDDAWEELALQPSARVAYDRYRELATSHLARVELFEQSHFLPEALAVAFRNNDWISFDGWVAQFRALPEALRHGHGAAAVTNLEGLRALREGRTGDAEAAMREYLCRRKG